MTDLPNAAEEDERLATSPSGSIGDEDLLAIPDPTSPITARLSTTAVSDHPTSPASPLSARVSDHSQTADEENTFSIHDDEEEPEPALEVQVEPEAPTLEVHVEQAATSEVHVEQESAPQDHAAQEEPTSEVHVEPEAPFVGWATHNNRKFAQNQPKRIAKAAKKAAATLAKEQNKQDRQRHKATAISRKRALSVSDSDDDVRPMRKSARHAKPAASQSTEEEDDADNESTPEPQPQPALSRVESPVSDCSGDTGSSGSSINSDAPPTLSQTLDSKLLKEQRRQERLDVQQRRDKAREWLKQEIETHPDREVKKITTQEQLKMVKSGLGIAGSLSFEMWRENYQQWRTNDTLATTNPQALPQANLDNTLLYTRHPHLVGQYPELVDFYRAWNAVRQNNVNSMMNDIRHRLSYSALHTTYVQTQGTLIGKKASGVRSASWAKDVMFRVVYPIHEKVKEPIRDLRSKKDFVTFGHILSYAKRWNMVEEKLGKGTLGLIPASLVPHSLVQRTLRIGSLELWLKLICTHNQRAIELGRMAEPVIQAALDGGKPSRKSHELEMVPKTSVKKPVDQIAWFKEVDDGHRTSDDESQKADVAAFDHCPTNAALSHYPEVQLNVDDMSLFDLMQEPGVY